MGNTGMPNIPLSFGKEPVMRARCAAAFVVLLCIQVLAPAPARAKDEELFDLEGAITVDVAASTVTVDRFTLRVDDGTEIEVNDDYASLEEAAAFIRRNPDVPARASYMILEGVLVAVYVDVDVRFYGALRVDAAGQAVVVDGQRLAVTPETDIWIGYEDLAFSELVSLVARLDHTVAEAYGDRRGGVLVADSLTVANYGCVEGVLRVDPARQRITVGRLDMLVYEGTDLVIDATSETVPTLDELAALSQRFPSLQAYASYYFEEGTEARAESVTIILVAEGPFQLDTGAITLQGLRVPLSPETRVFVHWEPATLAQLAALRAANPDAEARVDFIPVGADIVAAEISAGLFVEGALRVDGAQERVTVGGRSLRIGPDTYIDVEDEEATIQRLREFAARNPRATAFAYYEVLPSGDALAIDLYVEAEAARARAHGRRSPSRAGLFGELKSLDSKASTLTVRPRGSRSRLRMNVARHTAVAINGARVPAKDLTRVLPDATLISVPARVEYGRASRRAARVWLEPRLRVASGVVRKVTPSALGPRITVERRPGQYPRVQEIQLFRRSLVIQGRGLVRAEGIRRGDSIKYDAFNSAGRTFAPRVLLLRTSPRR